MSRLLFPLCLLLLGVVPTSGCSKKPPSSITILYEDPKGLTPGDLVQYRDTVIGKVTQIHLRPREGAIGGIYHVTVDIAEEYVGIPDHQMAYRIVSEKFLGAKKKILIADPPKSFTSPRPVHPGELVVGYRDEWSITSDWVKAFVHDWIVRITDSDPQTGESLKELVSQYLDRVDDSRRNELLDEFDDVTKNLRDTEREVAREIKAWLKSL